MDTISMDHRHHKNPTPPSSSRSDENDSIDSSSTTATTTAAPTLQNQDIVNDNDAESDTPLTQFSDGIERPLTFAATTSLLYTSHLLSTFNSRLFEFGAVLFLAEIFPGTLLIASIYALVRSGVAVLGAPSVGRVIDSAAAATPITHSNAAGGGRDDSYWSWLLGRGRLGVVRLSIVGQRIAVSLSCVILWVLSERFHDHENTRTVGSYLLFVGLVCLACVEKLCSIMNLVAVERDWVVTIADADERELQRMNSQMRRIDLFCKLVGPIAISFIDAISLTVAIGTTFCLNAISVVIEYYTIAAVFKRTPALQRQAPIRQEGDIHDSDQGSQTISRHLASISHYIHHRCFLPSFSLSLLYLTVLTFGGQMVTYLISAGYRPLYIGLIRAVSVVFEISATWIAPKVMARIGPVRAGIWFVNYQVLCLGVAVGMFWFGRDGLWAASWLVMGVIFSRVGLWGFDLSAQVIIQEGVESYNRGSFSTVEASFQNAFEMCAFASTIVFYRPIQFRYPVVISAGSVVLAAVLYTVFVRKRRGHLLHPSRCITGKDRPARNGPAEDGSRWERLPFFANG